MLQPAYAGWAVCCAVLAAVWLLDGDTVQMADGLHISAASSRSRFIYFYFVFMTGDNYSGVCHMVIAGEGSHSLH